MNILFVVSEIFPLVKTGGLADVAGGLPPALRALGDDVRVIVPAYRGVAEAAGPVQAWYDLGDPLGAGPARLGQVPARGEVPPIWLIDCPHLYDRPGGPYQDEAGNVWPDNHVRFGLLSRVAAMLCDAGALIGWRPDILHAHDWHAGLAPAYLRLRAGRRPVSVFTIHNLAYTGQFPAGVLEDVGLPLEAFAIDGVEYFGGISFMKAGLQYSDHITTVSPTYGREILSEEFGNGFAGLLRSRRESLSGILNGIDDHVWDPTRDPLIEAGYGADTLDRKARNKAALRRAFDLPDGDGPVLAVVSRLTTQKGLDLVLEALPAIIAEGGQLVVLGSGDRDLSRAMQDAAAAHPGQVALRLAYDEPLAHRIQAGADLILVPSRQEPCGLTQLYGLRYGTLPVVRRTGGLADTVADADASPRGTGFVFDAPSADALAGALRRAFALYGDPEKWRRLQRRAMAQDFGWRASAGRYRTLYEGLADRRVGVS